MKEFHIAFYLSKKDKLLSGKNYKGKDLIDAVNKFKKDTNTPKLSDIKYIYEKEPNGSEL